ncbi:hypothetical protein B0H12DRAFT_1076159 [Mycena haematopus]|nr:hypothetical protein B0H12DRAFT_1076159 [Mycena haematopus]
MASFNSRNLPTYLGAPDAASTPPARPPTQPPESSFGSVTCEGDYSALGDDFFQSIPALQPPGDSTRDLQMPTLPMPGWSYLPEGAEEQAEMAADPNANDSDDFQDYKGGGYVDEEEEDQLDDSSARDSPESPLLRVRGNKRPLQPQEGMIQPLRFLPPPAEEQYGGGYRHREATPPMHPPATRLRGKITPSSRAVGNPKATAMHQHREESVKDLTAAPPSFNPAAVPSSNPVAGPSSNPAAAPPFLNPFNQAPTRTGGNTKAAATHQRREGREEFVMAAPPPFNPAAPPHAVAPPFNLSTRPRTAAPMLSFPPPGPPPGPPAPPFPSTPQRLPGLEPQHRRPHPQPAWKGAKKTAQGKTAQGKTAPGETAPKPVSQRATSHEPGGFIAQARADATPNLEEHRPPVRSLAPLAIAAHPLPPPPHDPSYQHAELPPPPPGYKPALAVMPSPGSNAPAGALSSVAEESYNPASFGENSDDDDNDAPIVSTSDAKDVGGRPSKVQASLVEAFVKEVRLLAESYGKKGGLPPERFLTAFARSMSKGGRSGNDWNAYQAFACSHTHCVEEYQRIHPDFDPTTMDIPQLTAGDLSQMYKKFLEAFPDGEAEIILEKHADLALLEQEESLASRQRHFDRVCSRIRSMINTANERQFEAIVFICGSHVHEDSELADVLATPALETAFSNALRHSNSDMPLSSSDLLGIAKICAYSAQLKSYLESGVSVPDGLFTMLAGPTPSAKASAKAAKVIAKASPAIAAAKAFAKASTALGVKAPNASTSNAVAGPSKQAPTVVAAVKIQSNTDNIKAIRDRCCAMSQLCAKFDVFRDKGGRLGNFIWVPIGATLSSNNLRLLGYPTEARLPGEVYGDKGSGAWRSQDLTYLNVSLLEHESGSGYGLRLQSHHYTEGDLVIIGHNYATPAPTDAAAADLHWQTSGRNSVRCQDAAGNVWSARVDVRRAGDAAISKTIIAMRDTTRDQAGKVKEPVAKVKEPAAKAKAKGTRKAKTKSKPRKVRAKAKTQSDEEEEDEEDEEDDEEEEDYEEEEEEEEQQKPKGKGKEKARAAPVTAPVVKTKKRKAPSPASSDFFDEDAPEEEDPLSPPPAKKKLRSGGEVTPIPPPPPRTSHLAQQGGGKPTQRKNPTAKQVSFTPPDAPTASAPTANDPALVADRRKRMQAIPHPPNGGRSAEQDGDTSGRRKNQRDFLVAKPSAASAASSAPAHRSSTVAPMPPAAPPASQSTFAGPLPPAEREEVMRQLENVAPSRLMALLHFLQDAQLPSPHSFAFWQPFAPPRRPPQHHEHIMEGGEGQRRKAEVEEDNTRLGKAVAPD